IPKSSTTVIGRLVSKTSEPPNPRWLVAYDNYDDEDVAEERLGRVVGRLEEDPSYAGEDAGGSPETEIPEDDPATMEDIAVMEGPGTRRKRSSSQTGSTTGKISPGGSNGNGSSAEENTTIKSVDNNKKKKKGVTFTSRSRSNSEVSVSAKEDAASGLASMAASDREQRSRRRQAQTHEEALQAFETSGNKRPLANPNNNKSSSGGGSKNKKSKPVPRDGEVLKVKLLTGTLFLYKGANRHVEFIPKV
ncbi:MAG: hypothetical protein SGARI_002216, partial [Bacillariaceae sp.]